MLLAPAPPKVAAPDDAALVAAIRAGDAGAFRAFFERHHGPVLGFLARRGVPPEAADDVAQHAFVYLWEHRAALDPARSGRAYLYRIAYTRALNHFRSEARHTGDVADVAAPDEDAAQHALTRRALEQAIAALPERRRAVFELCFVQGLTHREAADALGIAPKTVEHQMGYALKAVRARMQPFL